MTDYLECLKCGHLTEVSEEDQDASLSDAIDHQGLRHGVYQWWKAAFEFREVTR